MIAAPNNLSSLDSAVGYPEAGPGKPASISSLEALLQELEGNISQQGQASLFVGEQLKLGIVLQRQKGVHRLRWGLREHEGWVFKATLLRFARGAEPVHLIVQWEPDGETSQAWLLGRSMDSFWALPLSQEQSHAFSNRHRVH